MKINSWFRVCTLAAVGAVAILVASRLTVWARDNQPGITVSSTPINRDARSGNSYSPIVKKAAPSVVNIYSARFVKQRYYRGPQMSDPFFRQFERTRRENSLGSGIIVTADGYILTANHVVDGADEVKVGISNDKTEYVAKIVGSDPATDIAVLKINAKNLPAITLGDSSQLEVGDVVLAIGNPFGLGQTVTRGIISALGRSLPDSEDGNTPQRYQDFIQTDASINKGNSGGALVDAEGRLIGINDAIVSPSGTSAGIGFAVPINMARNVLESFISGGRVARGYLGINPQDVDAGLAKSFGVPNTGGALVTDVGANTPAAKSGIISGDVIISINDKAITSADNLRVTVSQLRPGSQATVKFIRSGVEKSVVATLGELPVGNMQLETQPEPSQSISKADMLDGVRVANLDDQFREQLQVPPGMSGAVVTQVSQESNSAEAGLRPYDLILEVNRQAVASGDDAIRLGKTARSGQILLKVWRRFGNPGGTRYLSVDNARHTK